MKTQILILSLVVAFSSCGEKDSTPNPVTPIDNGPIGGSFTFTSSVTKTYDTIPGSGINTITEYTTNTTNLKGSIAITATTIASKGLMNDYTTTGTRKEVNTTTGATVTTTTTPLTGTSGATTTNYNSTYTISVASGELTINDAQYLFNASFISLPANKKYAYILTGNMLKITSTHYDAANKHRMVYEATFTK